MGGFGLRFRASRTNIVCGDRKRGTGFRGFRAWGFKRILGVGIPALV